MIRIQAKTAISTKARKQENINSNNDSKKTSTTTGIWNMNRLQPGVRVGGEIKGAEGVALPGHVLPQQVPGAVHLQVGLQVRLLLEKETLDFKRS